MTVTYYPVGNYQANCVIASDEQGHCVVIDPGDEAPRLLSLLKTKGDIVDAVLLTHAHFDHLLAVREVQEQTGAPLFLHADDVDALEDVGRSMIPAYRLPYPLCADRLLQDGDSITFGNATLTVIHTPGHTPGSCCYYGDGWLIAGDTLFAGSIGRTDFVGGNLGQMRESLRRLATLPDAVRVVSGHGEETTIGVERRCNPFLAGV